MPKNWTNKLDNVMNTKTEQISSGLVAVNRLLAAAKRCVHMHKMQVAQCGPSYTLIDGSGLEEAIEQCEKVMVPSGLVAVAWIDYNTSSPESWTLHKVEAQPTEIDIAKGFRCDPLVRLSDAEAIIAKLRDALSETEAYHKRMVAAKDAEINKLILAIADHVTVRSEYKSLIDKQAAALKLARDALIGALSDDQPYINASKEALAAIDAAMEGK